MQPNRQLLIGLLRQIAEGVQRLSNEDIDAVIGGRAQLSVSVERPATSSPRRAKGTAQSKVEPSVIREALACMASREQGAQYLLTAAPTKTALERVARCLDLPVQRGETVDRLREKILEATIGYRLRSQAIRGGVTPKET